MSELEQLILRGAIRDLKAIVRHGYPDNRYHDGCFYRANIRYQEALHNIVPLDLEGWLGRGPTTAERKAASRAYQRLAMAGLIKLHAGHDGARASRLQLTPAGIKAARRRVKAR